MNEELNRSLKEAQRPSQAERRDKTKREKQKDKETALQSAHLYSCCFPNASDFPDACSGSGDFTC
jgi:hypothetical protein